MLSDKIYLTPGPSHIFHTVPTHLKKAFDMGIPSLSHRGKEAIKIIQETTEALQELLELPKGYSIFFLSSANEVWDRMTQNLIVELSHHFVHGAFSRKFYDFTQLYRKQSTKTDVSAEESIVDFSIPSDVELIALTKNETSIGYTIREEEITYIRDKHPEAILALDIVSAVPSVPIDLSKVDTAYFSVQKGLGMPAGLGVWVVNEKCIEKATKKSQQDTIGSYRSIVNLKKFSDKFQTPETPNLLYIYVLGKLVQDLLAIGKDKIFNEAIYKSTLLNETIEKHPNLSHFVGSKQYRSITTVVANCSKAESLISYLKEKGLVVGGGYGQHKSHHIRIANFPAHSKETIALLCDELANWSI